MSGIGWADDPAVCPERQIAAVRLRVHVGSIVCDVNRTLLNSLHQFCAISSDPGLTVETAHKAGYTTAMLHRLGETEDSTIADLAVATNWSQIKTGIRVRSDRAAKCNEVIPIVESLEAQAGYAGQAALHAKLGAPVY